MNMRFWLSVATLVGTIIGVGMFGLPSVIAEAGWTQMAVVVCVGILVVTITHMAYAHVVLLTMKRWRLPGYAREWLGTTGKRWAVVSQSIGFTGSAIAYLVVGGSFLAQWVRLFTPFPDWAGVAVFFIAALLLVWRGIRSIAETELVMVLIMVSAIALLGFIAAPHWQVHNIIALGGSEGPWRAYGVLLFSLWGMGVVPQAADLVPRRRIGAVVATSVGVSVFISALFVGVAMGVTGGNIQGDALSSLVQELGMPVQFFGFAFGTLATFTSYLTLSRTTVDMLTLDFKFPFLPSFICAFFIPILLLFAGINDFVTVMAVTGAVSLGLEGALALIIERKAVAAHPRWKVLHIPIGVRYLVLTLLVSGIVIEILATLHVF